MRFTRVILVLQAEVQVLVNAKEAPEVYNMGADDLITVGPFECEGLDMRSSGIQALFRWAEGCCYVMLLCCYVAYFR